MDVNDDFYGRVKVLVMDASHSNGGHVVFEEAKKKWGSASSSVHSKHVEFFEEVPLSLCPRYINEKYMSKVNNVYIEFECVLN